MAAWVQKEGASFLETAVPFRAWRYSPAAGDLNLLVAPPYDVIGPELLAELYERSPYNVVHVDLGMTQPGDNDQENRYTRAAQELLAWKQSGIIQQDPEPTVTFVEEVFVGPDGRPGVRHGFLALMRLYEFEEGVVFPHERTLSGPKEDRFRLMQTTRMCLSPVFLLYDLPSDDITAAWKAGPGQTPPVSVLTDSEGTVTKLWPTAERRLLATIKEALRGARLIIADGHHRYETALRYRRTQQELTAPASERREAASPANTPTELGRQQASGGGQRPAWEYVLAYFVNMSDPGLAIYATHRLLHGLEPQQVASLPERLGKFFVVERLGGSNPQAAIADFLATHRRLAFGLWGPDLGPAYGLRLIDSTVARRAAPGHSAAYQQLDVTVLETLILGETLGITSCDLAAERYVAYVKELNEAFERLKRHEFQIGFFLNPTGIDQVKEVAFAGERMPQKATFFHPKLPTGLVFHDLTGFV
ncbi:MAG: DUF1015 domain-containing protein [Thermoleophilia bacterium]|nr:DUF1015 domain-containing protein [Thermoleophilia bacterium]